jgi:GT2 family glycosyltransferase
MALTFQARELSAESLPPRLSFVIPVRNDAQRLVRCLQSVTASALGTPVEQIVADNGSTDGSADAARALGARALVAPDLNVAALRNRAAMGARGEVVAFVDADHELGPGWIAAALDLFDDPGIGAAGALYSAPRACTWVQRQYGVLRGRTMGRADVDWLGSGNLAVRRTVFEQVGGFDESLQTCEDVELCRRIRQAGWRIVADERLQSVHLGDPRTLRDLFLAERWRGRDNLRVSLRTVPRAIDLPSILIPLADVLALLTLFVGTLVATVAGTAALELAAASAAVILLLSGLRAARMAARWPLRRPMDWLRAWAVATVYDVGRACSLVWPARHRHIARKPLPAVSEPLT